MSALHCAVSGWRLGPPSGANRRLLAMLRELRILCAADERITVLHAPGYSPPPSLVDDHGPLRWRPIDVPIGGAPPFATIRRAFAEQAQLPPLLRQLGANVYDHGFLPPPRTRSVPTCLLLHDLRAVDGESPWPRALARSVLRRACRRAQAIVVPSRWTAERLRATVPEAANVHVVPNATDLPTSTSEPLPPDARHLPRNGYLLHVGHIEARKNLTLVVDALARIDANRRPELWLLGHDAGALANLRRHAEHLGVAASVHPFGIVADDDLPSFYAHARAVVVPSRYEGFGLPALEGLAYGRPVLAADATSLPEVLGGAGTLLPLDDADAWARAMATAEPTDAHAATERRAAAARFSWARSAEKLLMVWRELAIG